MAAAHQRLDSAEDQANDVDASIARLRASEEEAKKRAQDARAAAASEEERRASIVAQREPLEAEVARTEVSKQTRTTTVATRDTQKESLTQVAAEQTKQQAT